MWQRKLCVRVKSHMSPSAVQAPASVQQKQKQRAAPQRCWDSRRLQAAARQVAQAAAGEPWPAGMQPPGRLAQGSCSWSCACCRPQSPKLSHPSQRRCRWPAADWCCMRQAQRRPQHADWQLQLLPACAACSRVMQKRCGPPELSRLEQAKGQ